MLISLCFRTAALAISLAPGLLLGQDLFSALGGVPAPQIRVTTDDGKVNLNATHQGFIRRAAYDSHATSDSGYGYGYESIHFTFASLKRINMLPEERYTRVLIRFYDANEVELYSQRLATKLISSYCPQPIKDAPCSYQVNMESLLLSLVNEVRRIDVIVVKYEASRRR